MKTNMNFGASQKIFSNAKLLRSRPTPAEEKLWEELRNNKLGVRFRRQHPLSQYVVDFYCHKYRLVIEVDGEIHADQMVQTEDQSKQESLISKGLNVIRFTNDQVMNHLDEVINTIKKILSVLNKSPLGDLGVERV